VSGPQAQRVQAQFGASAAAYVTSAAHAGGEDLDRLLAWGRKRRPARVLDLATGAGHTALAFAGAALRVVAYDLTEPMLHVARELVRARGAHNVSFVAGDVGALPFGEATFDVVTCRLAAHHFPDVAHAVRHVAHVLRPGGSFLVQDLLGHDDPELSAFILEVERRRDPSHVRAYRRVEWNAFLRAAGLTVIDEDTVSKSRPWAEWTARVRMGLEARQDLERFVRAAPPACRAAFDFRLTDAAVESFADRTLLLRADKD
jgi:SAM-dependent methyltransferase